MNYNIFYDSNKNIIWSSTAGIDSDIIAEQKSAHNYDHLLADLSDVPSGDSFYINADGNTVVEKSVFNPTYTTRDVVRANLINWLLTNKGERVFRPNFGANLRELIFEGVTEGSQDILEERITNTISEEFPMVTIVKVQFNRNEDRHTINFVLEYKIRNIESIDELNIELNG